MYDIIIIGGGVIGALVARELSRYDLKICLAEKNASVCQETSKANSSIVHAGFDCKVNSQKARFNVWGNKIMGEVCDELEVPFKRIGSLVIGFGDEDDEAIKEIYLRGVKNSVPDLKVLSGDETRALSPTLSNEITSALYAKSAGIVCPFRLTIHAAANAKENGVDISCNTEVLAISKQGESFAIKTTIGDIGARYIINAAGVYADKVAGMIGDSSFTITPRKGQYMLYDKVMSETVNQVIFQVPKANTKGILITPTVDGNLLIGPTAENIIDKEDKDTTSDSLEIVLSGAKRSVSSLSAKNVITSFSGLRAVSDSDDFIIGWSEKSNRFFNIAGIQSPGLSSAPAIAIHSAQEVIKSIGQVKINKNFTAKYSATKNIYEITEDKLNEIIKSNPAYGNIVCRCEVVTEAEIRSEIKNDSHDLDAIKRSTRAGAGRCQGGFCMPRVMEILAEELRIDITKITKKGDGSYVLFTKTSKGGESND